MLRVDPERCTIADLEQAVAWLKDGGIVAFPTDTFYGFAVDPSSPAAVDALFELKGRAADLAIPLIASSRAQVDDWCRLSALTSQLADAFWPGPLSVICDAPGTVAPAVHGGRGTVAIRVPDHAVARALAAAWGTPLTSTSANQTGQLPVTQAGKLADWSAPNLLVVDGGPTAGGPPSTIVDARGERAILVREGAIAWNRVLHSIQR